MLWGAVGGGKVAVFTVNVTWILMGLCYSNGLHIKRECILLLRCFSHNCDCKDSKNITRNCYFHWYHHCNYHFHRIISVKQSLLNIRGSICSCMEYSSKLYFYSEIYVISFCYFTCIPYRSCTLTNLSSKHVVCFRVSSFNFIQVAFMTVSCKNVEQCFENIEVSSTPNFCSLIKRNVFTRHYSFRLLAFSAPEEISQFTWQRDHAAHVSWRIQFHPPTLAR